MTKISVALIAKNEAHNIERCLNSARWADEIVVVDSGSTDATVTLAKQFTPAVFSHPFIHFADQKNFALSQCTGEWVFFLDADEVIPKALAEEIQKATREQPLKAYRVKRETYIFKKKFRFSGMQSDDPIRLFPRKQAQFAQPVHEIVETALPIERLKEVLIHYSTQDFKDYWRKLRHYVPLEVEWMRAQGRKKRGWDMWLRPPGIFIHLYFVKLGILDGLQGFVYALLCSYYAFAKYAQYNSPPKPALKPKIDPPQSSRS